MNTARLTNYRTIVRKYWLVFTAVVLLVGGAGVFTIRRQKPVFEASAQLLIREPQRRSEARGPNPWVLDQTQANTQQHLLRTDVELAKEVIERLKGNKEPASDVPIQVVPDPASLGYTKESLPGRVKIRTVPGTHLIRLSLTGSDGATLPSVVNAYAEEYRLREEGRRSEKYQIERAGLTAAVEAALTALREAEAAQNDFEAANDDIDWTAVETAVDDRWRDLSQEVARLEQQANADELERLSIQDALRMLGVVVDESGGRHKLSLAGDPATTVNERLAGDSVVASLECVRSNTEVRELRNQERAAQDRDRKLENEGRKPTDQRRMVARSEIEEARRQRGNVLVRVIERRLDRIAADAAYLTQKQGERDAAREKALDVTKRIGKHTLLVRAVDAAKRDHDAALTELTAYDAQYLATSDDPAEAAPTLRIDVRVPAKKAVQIAPQYTTQITLTILAAFGVALALVLLLDFLDDTIKTKDDIDRHLRVPFLGMMPRIKSSDAVNPDTAVLDAPPGSPIAEKFRALRTSIHFSRADAENPVRSMLITSASPGEGKTTVVSNLGITLAKQNQNVLLIDADLRKPRLSAALDVKGFQGLTSVLVGDATLDETVQPVLVEHLAGEQGEGRLCVLPSGPVPPNPAELLHLDKLRLLLEECREKFDRIIIDSPPILAVTDAHLLTEHVDGLYIVVLAQKTSRRVLRSALDSLESIGQRAKGVILNDRYRRGGGKGYGYYYDYTQGPSD